eukprot:12582226-Alexandrium_andersonii.AAC.1
MIGERVKLKWRIPVQRLSCCSLGRRCLNRSWCKYPKEGRVSAASIQAHHDVLVKLHEAASNLSFPKKVLVSCAGVLLEMHSGDPNWEVRSEHVRDYTGTMAA